ncbi:hypothetical protein [Candidatus Liberibacter solanacearum]|uniref:hypothetical protein n=1 Tax=Candidatus Liberibacter solanacearum TaxID=556287 RepID=UPI00156F4C48|nr:hypothetical protein [Candidatus Liberibacter solanacearum]
MISKKIALTAVLLSSSVLLNSCDYVSTKTYDNLQEKLNISEDRNYILRDYLDVSKNNLHMTEGNKSLECGTHSVKEKSSEDMIIFLERMLQNPSTKDKDKDKARGVIEQNQTLLKDVRELQSRCEPELVRLRKQKQYAEDIYKKNTT